MAEVMPDAQPAGATPAAASASSFTELLQKEFKPKTDLAAAVKEYLSDTAKAKPKRTLRKTFRNDAS